MKRNVYAIYDRATQSYGERPFTAINAAEAMRMISSAMKPSEGMPVPQLWDYAEDYRLDELATYDQSTGRLKTPKDGPTPVIELSIMKDRIEYVWSLRESGDSGEESPAQS